MLEMLFGNKEETKLKTGDEAPNFSLQGDDSQLHTLKNLRGKPVVLFFYPKDFTPGCTSESCDFNNLSSEFSKYSAAIIGISKDSPTSHTRFKSQHNLHYLLLSDPDIAVHSLYGAFGNKLLYGKSALGVIRSTFLIDKNGLIIKSWYKVRVKNHVQTVLDTLKKSLGTI